MMKSLFSMLELVRYLFSQRQYMIVFLVSSIAYFLVFSVSTGMIIYYPHSVSSLMHQSGFEIPFAGFSMVTPYPDWQNPSLVLIPTGNLEFIVQFGATFAAVAISTLTGINFMLLAGAIRNNRMFRTKGFEFVGFLAFVPALLTVNSCCITPLGDTLLSPIVPSSILLSLQYKMNWELDMVVAILMFLSILYSCKRIHTINFSQWR